MRYVRDRGALGLRRPEPAERHHDHRQVGVLGPGAQHGPQRLGAVGDPGRDRDEEQRVDLTRGEHLRRPGLPSLPAVLRRPRRPGCRCRWCPCTRSAIRAWSSAESSGTSRPSSSAASAASTPMPPALRHDAEPPATRQRLLGQQQRGLGPAPRRRRTRSRRPGRTARRHRPPGRPPPRCARRRRAGPRTTGRRPRPAAACARRTRRAKRANLTGVAEGLEVERRRGHLRVVVPGGEQVVAGHVGLVAQRDEGVHAQAELAGQVQQDDPDAAGLAGDRQPAGGGIASCERGVEADVGVVAEQAEAVGPDQRGCPGCGRSRPGDRCRAAPSAPSSPKPDEITTAARTPAAAASLSTSSARGRGDAEDDEVERSGDVAQRRGTPSPRRSRWPVGGPRRPAPAKPPRPDRAQHRRTDAGPVGPGTPTTATERGRSIGASERGLGVELAQVGPRRATVRAGLGGQRRRTTVEPSEERDTEARRP